MSIRSALEAVAAFHAAAGFKDLQDREGGDVPALHDLQLRQNLLKEEYKELLDAWEENDIVGVADAYADLIYVILGSALFHIGLERFEAVWKEVQRSNMAKAIDGKIRRRADGKVLKPEGWAPPDIASIVGAPSPKPTPRW